MALIMRRNGATLKPETERLGEIRERLRAEAQSNREDIAIYISQLRQRVHKYERRYEMTSQAMIDALGSKELKETRDISLWAWTWLTLNRFSEETPITGTH